MSARIEQIVKDWTEIRTRKIKEMGVKDLYFLFVGTGPRTSAMLAFGSIKDRASIATSIVLAVFFAWFPVWLLSFIPEDATESGAVFYVSIFGNTFSAMAVLVPVWINRTWKNSAFFYNNVPKNHFPFLEYRGFWKIYEIALPIYPVALSLWAASSQSVFMLILTAVVVTFAYGVYSGYIVVKAVQMNQQKSNSDVWRRQLDDLTQRDVQTKARKLFDSIEKDQEKTHASALATMSPDNQFKFKSGGARILYYTGAKFNIAATETSTSYSVSGTTTHWPEGGLSKHSSKITPQTEVVKKEVDLDGKLYFSTTAIHFIGDGKAFQVGYGDLNISGIGHAIEVRKLSSGEFSDANAVGDIRYENEFLEMPPLGDKTVGGVTIEHSRPKLVVDDIVLITSLLRYIQSQRSAS